MTSRYFDPRPQVSDQNGNPVPGAKLYTYQAGTSTPLATYTDSARTVPNANPIIMDAAGRPATDIFLADASYRLVLTDASDVTIWTVDPYDGGATDLSNALLTVSGTADAIILTSPFSGTAYETGQILRFIATSTNTSTTPSANWNGLGAKTITESDGSPLPTGAWGSGSLVELLYDGTNFRKLRPVGVVNYQPFLTNGGFDAWQISTSLAIAASTTATASIYAADQWCMETSANQACTISQQTGTGTNRYRARVARNSGQTGTSALRFQQPLEIWDCIKMRGKVMTVGFTAKAGANFSGTLSVKLLCGTGTEGRRTNAGAYTSETSPLSQSITLTTSDARYSATSTAVAATTTQASLVFEWTPSGTAGANDWFELQEVTLDFAGAAMPAVRESFQEVLERCQRFYWTGSGRAGATSSAASAALTENWISFPTAMRAVPTLVGGTASLTNAVSGAPDSASTLGFRFLVQSNSTAVNYSGSATVTASAQL